MPTIGPESYTVWLYVTYEPNKTEPRLEVHWNARRSGGPTTASSAESDILAHAENQDFETKLTITRTVTENAAHQSSKEYKTYLPEGQIAVQSAMVYLEKAYNDDYFKFIVDCWTCAQASLSSCFPKVFPS